MNTSRKAMEWLICFSIVNLMLGCLLFKNLKSNLKFIRYKGNGVVILDQTLYNNAIEEISLDTYKFEKFNEDPILKREASLQRLLRKLKQKNFFK